MVKTNWTRLIRFTAAEDHRENFGQPVDETLDVGLAYTEGRAIRAFVLDVSAGSAGPAGALSVALLDSGAPDRNNVKTVAKLLAPLSRTQVGTIRALGGNYIQPGQDASARAKRPVIPSLFYKPLTSLVGPGDAIIIPPVAKRNGDESDYEVELLVILGKDAKTVKPEQALDHVLGYSLANDVSARKRMFSVPQWGLGKSFDTFLPFGPAIVSTNILPDPENVRLKTTLNGTQYQDGYTKDHLWRVAETIAELSEGTTLEAGSVISMGTPPGEGFKRDPQVWLKHGDIVKISGDHGLGTLVNYVEDEGTGVPKSKL